ncbi:condensin complex subunit 3 isoform X2 [Sitophilus oryzae]|uniref:Condensin complex subunit 3 isoform X2 n=1 Tax=Sitophilus oryzae TaxID=7048 RepID=A0A6J2YCV0_SITOR|nr:condensin complex subunit 3 isoform X2 [Sitophilus oryzae]
MMKNKIRDILSNVQEGPVNHQKYIRLLKGIYETADFNEFLEYILNCIQYVLQKDHKSPTVRSFLDFIAKFIGHISKSPSKNNEDFEFETPTDPFLSRTIEVVLDYHKIENQDCRYNTCCFISTLLQNMDKTTNLDDELCDLIESAMLENTKDPKPIIRLQALIALVRLQDPMNPECPVIQSFMSCLKDPSHIVRREAVKRIAPNAVTIPKLKDRTRDVNANVRCAAFIHCGDLGLPLFRIIQRQHILWSGFNEQNSVVMKVFLNYFLPKWLSSVKGDYMTFFNAIRLDSDETDVSETRQLSKNLIEVFAKTEPINNLIGVLPLNDKKLLPVEKVECELVHYWDVLTNYLRKVDDLEEFLEDIIPELTAFCNYIEDLVKIKTSKGMNDTEYMNFESMLYYLLDMAEHFDLSDEVGRRTLDILTRKLLSDHWLQKSLLTKIIQIRRKMCSDVNAFAKDISNVISEKRNPIVEAPKKEDNSKQLWISKLKVELLCLKSDLDTAVSDSDFQKAAMLKDKITELNKKLESLNSENSTDVIRSNEPRTDQKTVTWCLDLLVCLLGQGSFTNLPPPLITLREDFVKPLIAHTDLEIQWRAFRCLASFCIFDEDLTKEHIKSILAPIISYQVTPNYIKENVVSSIQAISDLLRTYGPKIFDFDVEQSNSTRRRLYDQESEDVQDATNQISLDILLNFILDMLDDEMEELRDAAVMAYSKLILNGFYVTPTVMTRLILKWYNPATERILQQKLGTIISVFVERIKEARGIIAKCIVPVITTIASAPKSSPLVEVDIDNVVRFLATITQDGSDSVNLVHKELVPIILNHINLNPDEVAVPYLSRLLCNLSIDSADMVVVRELIDQADLLHKKEDLDKTSKNNIYKFINKLRGITTTNTTLATVSEETSIDSNVLHNITYAESQPRGITTTNTTLATISEETPTEFNELNDITCAEKQPSFRNEMVIPLVDCIIYDSNIISNDLPTVSKSTELSSNKRKSKSTRELETRHDSSSSSSPVLREPTNQGVDSEKSPTITSKSSNKSPTVSKSTELSSNKGKQRKNTRALETRNDSSISSSPDLREPTNQGIDSPTITNKSSNESSTVNKTTKLTTSKRRREITKKGDLISDSTSSSSQEEGKAKNQHVDLSSNKLPTTNHSKSSESSTVTKPTEVTSNKRRRKINKAVDMIYYSSSSRSQEMGKAKNQEVDLSSNELPTTNHSNSSESSTVTKPTQVTTNKRRRKINKAFDMIYDSSSSSSPVLRKAKNKRVDSSSDESYPITRNSSKESLTTIKLTTNKRNPNFSKAVDMINKSSSSIFPVPRKAKNQRVTNGGVFRTNRAQNGNESSSENSNILLSKQNGLQRKKKIDLRTKKAVTVNSTKFEKTPQVKRKKNRERTVVEDVDVESFSDSSDQTLHTIIEASEPEMSLLEDSQQSVRRSSRRIKVITTLSDSESPPRVRKSLRKT